jgi:hypothetical protein
MQKGEHSKNLKLAIRTENSVRPDDYGSQIHGEKRPCRGISLIGNSPLLGPYERTMPEDL